MYFLAQYIFVLLFLGVLFFVQPNTQQDLTAITGLIVLSLAPMLLTLRFFVKNKQVDGQIFIFEIDNFLHVLRLLIVVKIIIGIG